MLSNFFKAAYTKEEGCKYIKNYTNVKTSSNSLVIAF